MGGRNVAMLPSRYAIEHFNMPLPSGVLMYFHSSLVELRRVSMLVFNAVRNVPACEQVDGGVRLSTERPKEGSSKFAGFRSVICLRIRSPVPGRINVAFLSFYVLAY